MRKDLILLKKKNFSNFWHKSLKISFSYKMSMGVCSYTMTTAKLFKFTFVFNLKED